jgi:hypothetical protein
MGVLLVGSIDVLVDRVWVHGTANRGIGLQSDLGPTSMTVRSSLFEQCTEVGLFLKGADAIVEASVIRATQPNAQGLAGRGINARAGAATASVVMRGTLIDQNREAGVHFAGVNATVEESVIRDTSPSPQRFGGFGMDAQTEPTTGATSTLVLRASWIGQNENVGLLVEGSQVTVERSVIRDTLSGHGIDAHDHHATGALSTLLLDRSLLADNQEIALLLEGSAATVDRSAIRATQPGGVKGMGRGIGAQASAVTATAATLSVFGSLVEQSYDIGIFASGANATVEATWVRDTQPNGLGVHGHGLSAQQDTNFRIPSTLVVRTSLVERSHGIAILVSGSTGTIESSLVVDTQPDGNDNFGDGIVVAFESAPASVTLTGLRIDRSARAALGAFGAYVGLSGSALSCQAFDLDSEDYLGSAPELDDLGGNRCGCPDASLPCKAVSAGLQPPEAIEQTVH